MNSPKACDVALQTEKFLGEFGGGGARVTGGHRVNHHEVAAIEQRRGIVFHAIRGGGHESVGLEHDAFRTERAHVQPDRCRSGAAVEREGQRALAGVLAVERVSDKKHFGFNLAVAALDRQAPGGRGVGERSCRSARSGDG